MPDESNNLADGSFCPECGTPDQIEARLRGEGELAELQTWQAHLEASPSCRVAADQDAGLRATFAVYRADPFFEQLSVGWKPNFSIALQVGHNGFTEVEALDNSEFIAPAPAFDQQPESNAVLATVSDDIPLLPETFGEIEPFLVLRPRRNYWSLALVASLVVVMIGLLMVLISVASNAPSNSAISATPTPVIKVEFVGLVENGKNRTPKPGGIALDKQGNLYMVDNIYHVIEKFDRDGVKLDEWGKYGSQELQFNRPWGIAIDAEGNFYIADTDNSRVQKLNSMGGFLLNWGSVGSGEGQFNQAKGIAIDRQGNVYVADSRAHRILKFDSTGRYLGGWGQNGSGDGQFSQPGDVAVDGQGNVYVADALNHRIQKFDNQGRFLLKWGSQGETDGQFRYPQGLALDRQGNVYIADSGNHRVQKFDSTGRFLLKWAGQSEGDGQLEAPQAIALDESSGYIYVSDSKSGRVLKFRQSVARN